MMGARLLPLGLLGAAFVAAALLLASRGDGDRRVHATFSSAVQLVPGARVTAAGVEVGAVDDITLADDGADVALRIDDEDVWPLPEGTRATIRWGGTASYANRYVELTPGPPGGAALPDGARLAAADTVTPVELDELLDSFDPGARRGLAGVVDGGARTFGARGPALADGVTAAGPAFDEAAEVFRALGSDRAALRTLVVAGAGTATALARDAGALTGAIDGAGRTFEEIAANARQTRRTLAALPGTLRTARATLGRTDRTLRAVAPLVDELRPGGRELRRLSRPLGRGLRTLRTVAPELDGTLVALRTAAPPVAAVLDGLEPMVACLRPYAPEIAGFLTSWSSIGAAYDAQANYGRVLLQSFPFPNAMPASAAEVQRVIPGLGYALVRPPGFGAFADPGGTWLQPQCGSGADGVDATKDPEAP